MRAIAYCLAVVLVASCGENTGEGEAEAESEAEAEAEAEAEGEAPEGLTEVVCDGTFSICGVNAGCALDDGEYVSGEFPGTSDVIVTTKSEATIRTHLALSNQQDAGTFTLFIWQEPDCVTQARWDSTGMGNIFELAGSDGIMDQSATVSQPGQHLVRVQSDATASYDIWVEVE